MSRSIKKIYTIRQAIVKELSEEWNLKESDTLEELKKDVEKDIYNVTQQLFAEDNVIGYEDFTFNTQNYIEAFNHQEFSRCNIAELSENIVDKYPNIDSVNNVYSVIHKVIANSDGFLIKPEPGVFEINFDSLVLPGMQVLFGNSEYIKALSKNISQLKTEIELIFQELDANNYFLNKDDTDMLNEQLRLIYEMNKEMQRYNLKFKFSKNTSI